MDRTEAVDYAKELMHYVNDEQKEALRVLIDGEPKEDDEDLDDIEEETVIERNMDICSAVELMADYNDGEVIMWREDFPDYGYTIEGGMTIAWDRNPLNDAWARMKGEGSGMLTEDFNSDEWIVEKKIW